MSNFHISTQIFKLTHCFLVKFTQLEIFLHDRRSGRDKFQVVTTFESLITFFTVLISNIIIETQKETKIVAVYLFQRYFNDNVIGYNQKDVGRLKETK